MKIDVHVGRNPNNNGGSTTTALVIVTEFGALFNSLYTTPTSHMTELEILEEPKKGLAFVKAVTGGVVVMVGTTIKSTKDNDNYLTGCKKAIKYALQAVPSKLLRTQMWNEILPRLLNKFPRNIKGIEPAPGVHPTTVTFNEKFRRFIK